MNFFKDLPGITEAIDRGYLIPEEVQDALRVICVELQSLKKTASYLQSSEQAQNVSLGKIIKRANYRKSKRARLTPSA